MSKANSLFIRASLVSLGKYLNAILILFKYCWVWETLEKLILIEGTLVGKTVKFVITVVSEDDTAAGVGESISKEVMSVFRLKDN